MTGLGACGLERARERRAQWRVKITGVMEYWSAGVMENSQPMKSTEFRFLPNTPLLQHANTPANPRRGRYLR